MGSHANATRLYLEANLEVNYSSLQIKVELETLLFGLLLSIILQFSSFKYVVKLQSFIAPGGKVIATGN